MKCVGEFSGIKIYTLGDNEMILSQATAGAFSYLMKQIFPMTKAAAEEHGAPALQTNNNARDEIAPGCYGCKHLMADQDLNTYPCRGCIRVRRVDLFDSGATSPIA